MLHKESSVKIYFTRDYKWFSLINGNRNLNRVKIKKIRNDIVQGLDVLRFCPILVKENGTQLDIIDGQHRFQVAMEMNSPIWYVVVEDFTIHDIAKINSNTEKWRIQDYINCYKKQKNDNYQKLESFMTTYGFPLSVAILLLSKGKTRGDGGIDTSMSDKFKRGNFVAEAYDKAVKFADTCSAFKEFSKWNSRTFITAIETILTNQKCDFAELVDKFKADPKALEKRGLVKEYLNNLEEIYNFRMRTRRVIY